MLNFRKPLQICPQDIPLKHKRRKLAFSNDLNQPCRFQFFDMV